MSLHFSSPSFEEASAREWLVSNGIGGYASASLCGANTRRYHGLLVAAQTPPTGRQVLVSKIEEQLSLPDGEQVWLSCNQYPGAVHPQGHLHLSAFEASPLPRAVYEARGQRLSKTVFMKQGENTTVVEYANLGPGALSLRLLPLLVFRDYHSLFRESPAFDFYAEAQAGGRLRVYPHPGAAPLHLRHTQGSFTPGGDWYRRFQYAREAERGQDFEEDARSIGEIALRLLPGERAFLVFSTEAEALEGDPESWKLEEAARLNALASQAQGDPFLRDLAVSGDQFLVWRQSTGSYSLLAGYHWFTDWGRDTMIAMRGLAIATRRKAAAESILRTFLRYLDRGMIPNRFPDSGEGPEYNTADASLWLFVVLYEYHERFRDLEFVRELFPSLGLILEAHLAGTRYQIHTLEEGLLFCGEGNSQLTWMDARIGDYVVTPRHGCPVEINALWYNALRIYQFFHAQLHGGSGPYEALAAQVLAAFRDYFPTPQGYLNDVVIPGHYADDSLRPNQVYALSLPFPLLEGAEARRLLSILREQLWTPFGLRSLAPAHRDYHPRYEGGVWERDSAYHQGSVWAFLWGEYALAWLRQEQFSKSACQQVWQEAQALRKHFYESGCLHGISEIFDAERPAEGRGCVHQAWSVGMLLRVFLDPAWRSDAYLPSHPYPSDNETSHPSPSFHADFASAGSAAGRAGQRRA